MNELRRQQTGNRGTTGGKLTLQRCGRRVVIERYAGHEVLLGEACQSVTHKHRLPGSRTTDQHEWFPFLQQQFNKIPNPRRLWCVNKNSLEERKDKMMVALGGTFSNPEHMVLQQGLRNDSVHFRN